MRSNLSRYNDLTQRVITALVGAVVIILSILWNEWSYFALFLFISILTQLEFYRLLRIDEMTPLRSWGTISGIAIYVVFFFEQQGYFAQKYYWVILPIFYTSFFIKLYRKDAIKPFTNIGLTFLGIIYVALPFSLLHLAAYYSGEYSPYVVLGIILIQWANDTGAFIAGSIFGKRKLFERVSPKKSWEGFAGGVFLAGSMSIGVNLVFDILPPWQWIGIAIIISVVGTYGDLVESLFKRSIEIKDSGTSIPGHGGFLDRFDSLLLSLPFIILFLKIF